MYCQAGLDNKLFCLVQNKMINIVTLCYIWKQDGIVVRVCTMQSYVLILVTYAVDVGELSIHWLSSPSPNTRVRLIDVMTDDILIKKWVFFAHSRYWFLNKVDISVVPVGPGQVMKRSWFSPGPVTVLTQIIPKPVSLHPCSGPEHSSIMLRTFLNHAQNIPQSCSEQCWFWASAVLNQVQDSP